MGGGTGKRSAWLYLQVALLVGVVAYSAIVFRSLLFLLGPVGGLLLAALFGSRSDRERKLLLGLPSRQALTDYISQNPGNWVSGSIWLEYAVARCVARGDYYGQPPSEMQEDWYYLVREVSPHTKANQRFMVAAGGIGACLSFALAWVLWDLHSYVLALFLPTVLVLGYVFYYFRSVGFSDDPMTILAHRVEAARSLTGQERWETLLAIAENDPSVIAA